MKENIILPEEHIAPKGRVKIEVFDKNGNLVGETKKHNYIKQSALSARAKALAYYPFGNSEMGWYDIANAVVLTNSESPTNPDGEIFIEGDTIGYAVKGYNGGTELRGTYNTLESIHRLDYQKFVFDFATSEANGTFQSIYMYRGDYKYSYEAEIDSLFRVPTPFNFTGVYAHEGKLYFIDYSGKKVYEVDKFDIQFHRLEDENVAELMDFKTYDVGIAGNSIYSMSIVGDYVYFAGSSRSIMKAPLSNMEDIKQIAEGDNSISSNHRGMVYDYKKGVFYRVVDNGILVLAPTTFEVLDHYKIFEGTTPFTDDLLFYHTPYLHPTQPNILVLSDVTYDLVTGAVRKNSTVGVYTSSYLGWVLSDEFSIYLNSRSKSTYSYFNLSPSPQFFSRVLLDSPVSKTSQNTMKITYEWIIPPLSLPIPKS